MKLGKGHWKDSFRDLHRTVWNQPRSAPANQVLGKRGRGTLPAQHGALIAAKPRILDMIHDAATAGLIPKQPLLARLDTNRFGHRLLSMKKLTARLYLQKVKTEHLAADTFFKVLSVSRTFEHFWPFHTHMRVAQAQDRDMIGTCCTPARLHKNHPLSQHVSSTSPRRAWPISIILFHVTSVHTEVTAYHRNQETLRHSASRDAVSPSGWIISSHRLWAQDLHRCQQWAHADQLHLEEKQLQHREQWPCHHSHSLRELRRFSSAGGSQQQVW